METRQIHYFLAVYQSGSITSAARVLHVNQSTLSRQIAALEEEIGAELFSRGTAGISLTEAGEVFLREGKELLLRYERMRDKITRIGTGSSGQLLIGMPMNLFGNNAIFHRYDPSAVAGDVDFRHSVLDFAELNQGLLSGDIDLAVTYDFAIEEIRDELEYRYIFNEPFVFFVRQGHCFSGKETVTVDDLLDNGLAVLKTNIVPPFLRQAMRRQSGKKSAITAHYAPNPESMMMTVSTSNRVGVVPKSLFESSQEAYGLVALNTPEIDTGAEFVMAHLKNKKNPLIQTYIDILRTYIWNRKW